MNKWIAFELVHELCKQNDSVTKSDFLMPHMREQECSRKCLINASVQ